MKPTTLIREIVNLYRKHGWELRSILLRPQAPEAFKNELRELSGVEIRAAEVDALWFSRPSNANREAWELRLLSENPYALFETFEADEPEDARAEVRQEMEARMREHVGGEEREA